MRRRRDTIGLALASMASLTIVAQSSIVTDASWNDSEWTHASLQTPRCGEPSGAFATQAEGRALSGSLLGIDLDHVAEAQGVHVENHSGQATASAGQPVPEIEDAWADPLTVGALSAIRLPLTGLLELPTNNNTGVLGQFAQATGSGTAVGASGYVTNSGGIDLADEATGYPDLATLYLSDLLSSPLLGGLGVLPRHVVNTPTAK